MKTIRIFLASSNELKDDRIEFENFIARENKIWKDAGIYFEMEIWEDALETMSKTRKQSDYNKIIAQCDFFVMLFFTKVGKYTEEEFDYAYQHFQNENKPLLFTYFKDAPVNTGQLNDDTISLLQFKKKLDDLEHFQSTYTNMGDLKHQFGSQLAKLYRRRIEENQDRNLSSTININQTHNGNGDNVAGDKIITNVLSSKDLPDSQS